MLKIYLHINMEGYFSGCQAEVNYNRSPTVLEKNQKSEFF